MPVKKHLTRIKKAPDLIPIFIFKLPSIIYISNYVIILYIRKLDMIYFSQTAEVRN